MGKKKQTVLETAILLTLITGAMFPVTGQATNRNVAQIGVDNAGKLITVGTETQWELEWNAIAKAPTSLKPFGVGYNQVDTSTSPTGLSVYADTVKIESTQAPRQSYGLSLNDTNPKGNAATAQNHTVNITAGNIAIKAEGGTNTRFGDMVAGVNTYYVPVNMKANNELTIAANNKNNANRSPASYVIQTDSAPVSLEASDITLSTKGKRLVRGIRVDTTQTDLPGSVTLQASGALHVQSELVDD